MRLAVAIPACCRSASEIRVGYALESLALQQTRDISFDIWLRDEGAAPCLSDRWTRLIVDLLGKRGHTFNYLRRNGSTGVATARHDLLDQIPSRYEHILLLDDDMVLLPDAVEQLFKAAEIAGKFGFVQGTKLELDPEREYMHDINVMNHVRAPDALPNRIYFGDAAFLLVTREALSHINWSVVARFEEQNMPGEDVAMSLMIADEEPCYGAPAALGYHMSLEQPRWRWEPSSDALQLQLLRGVVSSDTLRLALPHMARYIDGER